ncbi:MAG TPA: hypothetical protein QF646_05020, partial [Candidatus Poseidoniales archaeon]|nr:hypothetical protein [Candidatus Poseidoniales archaeon]
MVTTSIQEEFEISAMEWMPNHLVCYGTTANGIAIVEMSADGDGKPLEEGGVGPNCYTHQMMRDLDEAFLRARFDDKVSVIILTGA